jgi:uncharacterized membrane protein YhiD involved in acid resistance
MPDFLNGTAPPSAAVLHAAQVAWRLVLAAGLGFIVAWVYRRTRKSTDVVSSFPTTLVLLCTLIAMVTQVIGESVARAFSLVGALSIVRFRTVVRDTQDTAYVIFAVAVGMAVGAQAPWVGLLGIAVVGITAFLLRTSDKRTGRSQPAFILHIRVPLGYDLDRLQGTLDSAVASRDLFSIETAKQGSALDLSYEVRLHPEQSANELVRSMNKIEGVLGVELQKRVEEA